MLRTVDWIATTQVKVDAAISSLAANGGHDGETAISQLLDRFRQAREVQHLASYQERKFQSTYSRELS